MSKTFAVVPAAGRGIRMGRHKPKQFLELEGHSILFHTLVMLSRAEFLSGIILVVPREFVPEGRKIAASVAAGRSFGIEVIAGGAERQHSVSNGLHELSAECEWVLIHDGVRPFASTRLLRKTWEAARETGAAIAALQATDTIKVVDGDIVHSTLDRSRIWCVQTPQVFRKEILLRSFQSARERCWSGTDDASFVERIGVPVKVVCGEPTNIKVTTPEDLAWAEWFHRRAAGALACDG